ncbi:MAG: hypothetical protein RIN55_07600 [Tissierellaceae bacterium]|nr:hypothetical protein [Tissierellaceae bacterium]
MNQELIALSVPFAEIAARNSANWVNEKIATVRMKKDLDQQQNEYEDIINKLLADKYELQRIAQSYKELYEEMTISDEDIEYLHNTLEKALDLLITFIPDQKDNGESLKMLISLLNKDALKTMQLLGFNYKEAIGKPLTEVCSSKILGLADKTKSQKSNKGKGK